MKLSVIAATLLALGGCQSVGEHPPLKLADRVDLERFMGDWYVIANIPTFIEQGAHNAVESYRLAPDGTTIPTTFSFRAGGFDGEPKRYTPTGFVRDRRSNAVWGMQFVWPIKADYRIVYVAEDYSTTIIGREKRDYAWIMARKPAIPEAQYRRLVGILAEQGYDISRVRKVPQRWN
jgi:apolipoprotein D and lipocalin family protein